MTPRQAVCTLIVVSALVRLGCALGLGLGNDEAYHYLYAAHPALSYYDHPPMMAWIETLGLALPGAGAPAWAIRIGFIALFAGSTWFVARLTTRYYGAKAGFIAALALNVTGYYGLAASTFALPDGPLLFFWLLTIDRLSVALEDRGSGRLRPWIWVGLAWGGAMLSKYHAVLIPLGTALYLILHRPARRWLFQPGPYLALGLGLLLFSPVVVWNAQHGWVSFLFQGGRAVGSSMLRPDYLATAVLAQALYLFPWIWLPLVVVLARGCRDWRRIPDDHERLWICLGVVPLSVFAAVACFRVVLPHWGLIGLVPLLPILGRNWSARLEQPSTAIAIRRLLAGSAAFSLVFLGFTISEFRYGFLQRGPGGRWGLIDARNDPTLDLYGWDQVARRIHELGLLEEPNTFVFTRYWYQSAQLAYALGCAQPVLCYNADDPRGFAFWSRPEDWVGSDGIFVAIGEPDALPRYYARWFAQVALVSDFWVERSGKPVRRIGLYRCTRQRVAYPFALDRAPRVAQTAGHGDIKDERSAR
jgi:hypothetical protein